MPDTDDIITLTGIGPTSAEWLRECGLHTRGDLQRIGVVEAYRRVRQHRANRVNHNLLWALYGGLHDIHWTLIPPKVRKDLKLQVAQINRN